MTPGARSPFPPISTSEEWGWTTERLVARQIPSMNRILFLLHALVALLHSAAAAPRYSRNGEVRKENKYFSYASDATAQNPRRKEWEHRSKGSLSETSFEMASLSPRRSSGSPLKKGGDGMPSFSETLSPQQMDQLIAYLKEL